MKKWNIFCFDSVLCIVLFLLMTVNVIAVFSEDKLFAQYINALSIPVFVTFALLKVIPDNISFFFFCLFVFLSDSSSLLFHDVNMFYATSVFYVAACIHLLILVFSKIKSIHIDKPIKAYLLLMFLIITFFLSLIYNAIEQIFNNSLEGLLFVVKSLAFIVLGLGAFGVYLSSQNKKSIFFLTAVICFGFSTIFDFVNIYFLSEWRFEICHQLLHIIGIFFMFKFIIVDKLLEVNTFKYLNNNNRTDNNILA
jgi:hypothetical protein